jgi:anhydro-N-acetylmuramic acid kinase
MISGTSFDAVEALLADLEVEGTTLVCDLVDHRSVPYPGPLRKAVAAMLPPAATTIEQVCQLDVAIGQFFATVARGIIDDHGEVAAVCSHGQTVFHWVDGGDARGTLQLGQPAWIAESTGATVVSDVRNRDIAAGGHGAPLASLLDVLLFGPDAAATAASLNLGGIANATVVSPGQAPVAFDIGPANALLDATVEWLSGGHETYDHEGAWAAMGTADPGLVGRLLDDPYFSLPAPKSTGKEYFNLGYVTQRLKGEEVRAEDLLASLTAATAESVASALRPYQVAELLVAGGGTRNLTMMRELAARLPGVPLRRTDELGVPEGAKEALVFAVIGFLTLSGLPASVPSCTGAARASVLGSITPGAGERAWPVPPASQAPTRPPTRLVVRTPLPAS